MKRFTKAIAAIMLMTAVIMTACNPEDEPNNGGGNNGGGDADDHEYVDLGLPSGTLWATCNMGADTPEGFGDYFAWGETETKSTYEWSTYKYCNGTKDQLTKYCNMVNYGNNGFTDNLTTLVPEDDAATVNWGNNWHIPTMAEWEELCQNTTNTWTTQNGVNGRLFTASNGKSLFLPAAGCYVDAELINSGENGCYTSSTLLTENAHFARHLYFNIEEYSFGSDYRSYGQSVRAVRSVR